MRVFLAFFVTLLIFSSALAWSADSYSESGDMEWFYSRYGYATGWAPTRFNEDSFSSDELEKLIKSAIATGQDGDYATDVLEMFVYPKLESTEKFRKFKDRLLDPKFLYRVAVIRDKCKLLSYWRDSDKTLEAFKKIHAEVSGQNFGITWWTKCQYIPVEAYSDKEFVQNYPNGLIRFVDNTSFWSDPDFVLAVKRRLSNTKGGLQQLPCAKIILSKPGFNEAFWKEMGNVCSGIH